MTSAYVNIPTGSITNAPILDGYQKALDRQKFRGIATLSHGNKSLTFRTNPNSVMWSYKLNTAVENTYGGRVVQILSTAMEDLKVVIECGLGGWNYAMKVAQFMRDMMIDQRGGEPGKFIYTTRGWDLDVYAVSIPFQDRVTETTREISLSFKIQEDVSGTLTKQTIRAELAKIKKGIGFSHNQFNTGTGALNDGTTAPFIYAQPNITETLTKAAIPAIDPFATSNGITGQNLFGVGGNITNISRLGSIFGL